MSGFEIGSQSRPLSPVKKTQEAEISDNPLDAPASPKPQNEEQELEDEEMGGTEQGAKKENGVADENADNSLAQQQTSGPIDGQLGQSKASMEASARSHLVSQTHSIILPSYTSWFDTQYTLSRRKHSPNSSIIGIGAKLPRSIRTIGIS